MNRASDKIVYTQGKLMLKIILFLSKRDVPKYACMSVWMKTIV